MDGITDKSECNSYKVYQSINKWPYKICQKTAIFLCPVLIFNLLFFFFRNLMIYVRVGENITKKTFKNKKKEALMQL